MVAPQQLTFERARFQNQNKTIFFCVFRAADDDSLDLEDFSRSSRRLSTLHEENEADCVSENSVISSPQSKHRTSIRRAQSAEKPSTSRYERNTLQEVYFHLKNISWNQRDVQHTVKMWFHEIFVKIAQCEKNQHFFRQIK